MTQTYITTNETIQTNFFVEILGNATHPNSFENPNVVVVYTYPPWILLHNIFYITNLCKSIIWLT